MKIVTLTLNPAFDMHCTGKDFKLGHETFFDIASFEAGGKGINISRALSENGVDNEAIVVVGKENGNEFCSKLGKDKIHYKPIYVNGRIRENIILHDTNGVETRVSFNGFEADEQLIEKVLLETQNLHEDSILTLTGSIPKGIPLAKVKEFVKKITRQGAKVVIDSRSFSLSDLIETKPFLIKPNQDEISHYLGKEISTIEDAQAAALLLFQKGIQNAMISLGKDGAVLASKEGVFSVQPPSLKIVSTIGAGDSSIAGFIQAFIQGKNSYESLKTAVSFGSAACLNEGTKPPLPSVIQTIFDEIK